MLERAAALRAPGAVSSCAPRSRPATRPARPGPETDWLQIVTLYEVLIRYDPSPVVHLNRAVAISHLGARADRALRPGQGGRAGDRLDGYHLFHATRAELLTRLGRDDEAAAANERALTLTANDAERRLLATRLHRHPLDRRVVTWSGVPPNGRVPHRVAPSTGTEREQVEAFVEDNRAEILHLLDGLTEEQARAPPGPLQDQPARPGQARDVRRAASGSRSRWRVAPASEVGCPDRRRRVVRPDRRRHHRRR